MSRRHSRVAALALLAGLVLPLLTSDSSASREAGPYVLQICADVADLIVVGVVVGTEDFESTTRGRVSSLEVQRCLYGDADSGDTLLVNWWAPSCTDADGRTTIITEPGPQLNTLTDRLAIWLVVRKEGRTDVSGDPILLSPGAIPQLRRYIAWIRTPRTRYGGLLGRDESLARSMGLDSVARDEKLRVLGAYLAGYVDGLIAAGTENLGRSN